MRPIRTDLSDRSPSSSSARLRAMPPRPPERKRLLATVLFTDIVDSTRKASELGDAQWRRLLGAPPRHHASRAEASSGPRDRYRGRRVLRHVRSTLGRDRLRRGDDRAPPLHRHRDPRRRPHGRGRGRGREGERHRRARRRPSDVEGVRRPGPDLGHRPRAAVGLGASVRRRRHARAQGDRSQRPSVRRPGDAAPEIEAGRDRRHRISSATAGPGGSWEQWPASPSPWRWR